MSLLNSKEKIPPPNTLFPGASPKKALEGLVLTRMMHLNATLQGIVTGLTVGLGVFIATNRLILKGGKVIGPHLALLGHLFIGYQVTFVGA